jgi:hypothetical protein
MRCARIAVLAVAGIAALGWVVMQLWNWLLPVVFTGAHTIGYVQAIGLLALCKILFGSMGCHKGCHGRGHQRHLEEMTPEEREKVQSGLRRFCCRSKS